MLARKEKCWQGRKEGKGEGREGKGEGREGKGRGKEGKGEKKHWQDSGKIMQLG